MRKTRLWTAMIAASALAFGGFGFTSPAQASTAFTFDCDSGGLRDVAPGDTIVFNHTGTCDEVRWTSDPSGNTTLTVNSASLLPTNSTVNFTSGQVEVTVGTLGAWFDVAFEMTAPNPSVSHGFNIVNSGGGGTSGGGTSSGAAASAPLEVSLSLDLGTSGASCTEGSSATGVAGAWMTLPGADSCTSQTTPDANLLGWATTADFPVDIAQRQIDNGWGAYELFDEEGRMTAVFIPAGGATFASASNTLHPIWAS